MCGIILPIVFFIFEFLQNQILISWKSIVWQYVFTAFYACVTACWQMVTGDAVIYPGALDWICATREGASPDCMTSECIMWFIYFMLIQTGCFSLVLFMHYLKSKYCCR